MICEIAKKEIRQNLLSYKFSIITILSTVLILLSIFIMYCDFCLARENHEVLRKESKTGRHYEVIPPTPLGIFAKGLDDNLCRPWELGGVGVEISSAKQKSLNDLFKLFSAPDLLYITKVILSLSAMLFAFDMVSGEKETGTLRQSLSNGLKRPIMIIGKWTGGFTSFILPFLVSVLIGTILVTSSPVVEMNPQDWAKLGLFVLSGVVYLAAFFSLGLLISCLTHRSSTSLVISLFVWTILVFLIPNLGNILARQFVPVPTVQQLELRREQIREKFRPEMNELKRIPEDRPEYKAREEALLRRMFADSDKLDENYRNRFNSLVRVSQNITRFSPAPAFTFLATDIMGTGMAEERRLKRTVQSYKNMIINVYFDENVGEDSMPGFHYGRSSVKEILSQESLHNSLVLILLNVLFLTGAYVAFLRYDVR
jgi:ABC-type transport system involved in multi-copper enzyme maturation permease subunit